MIFRYPNGTFNIDIPQYAFLPLNSNDNFDLASAEASTLGRSCESIHAIAHPYLFTYHSLCYQRLLFQCLQLTSPQ